jgi:hypothetical protein
MGFIRMIKMYVLAVALIGLLVGGTLLLTLTNTIDFVVMIVVSGLGATNQSNDQENYM